MIKYIYMFDIKFIKKHATEFKSGLIKRGHDVSELKHLFSLIEKRSFFITSLEKLQTQRNFLSSKIGKLIKDKPTEYQTAIQKLKKQVTTLKEDIVRQDEKVEINNKEIETILLSIPNLPSTNTPIGNDEESNVVIKEFMHLGKGLVEQKKDHQIIAEELDLIDFKRGVKISGSRFVAYKGKGAKLLRALTSFMLEKHITNGYTEFFPPVLVKTEAMQGTGQLPKFKEDLFKIQDSNLWLIPTGEVPLTNLYANEILLLNEKSIALTAITSCFRSEAGSGGKDNRGIIRMHQFNKVELVKIVSKKNYEKEFNATLQDAQGILKDLELPFQLLQLCAGDIGFAAEETIDLEVWMPSENRYREISSVSKFGQFQARRTKMRYRNDDGSIDFAYTINGSGLAIDRVLAAILENNYNNDGSLTIPKVLVKYMGEEVITNE